MVTSPNTFFSQQTTGEVSIGLIPQLATPARIKYYHGCRECTEFSGLFGGTEHRGVLIDTEEKFEIEKAKFVKHFNESHMDLYNKRKNKGLNGKNYTGMTQDEYTSFIGTRIKNANITNEIALEYFGRSIMSGLSLEDCEMVAKKCEEIRVELDEKERVRKYNNSIQGRWNNFRKRF